MNAPPLVDVNVTLGRWPMRRMPLDETEKLIERLRQHNVLEAWAGSFDGLFHEDLRAVNDRLAASCRAPREPRLLPFGSINPLLPGWREELRRCAAEHGMPGLRLHPNYHGYKLERPEFAELLELAAEHRLVVALSVLMEDERMMHPLLRVPPVDLKPLATLVARTPGLRLVLLNGVKSPRATELHALLNAGEVYVEIAMLEAVAAIEELITSVSPERILFGSHAPSLYFESAVLKLQESHVPAPMLRAIASENARRVMRM